MDALSSSIPLSPVTGSEPSLSRSASGAFAALAGMVEKGEGGLHKLCDISFIRSTASGWRAQVQAHEKAAVEIAALHHPHEGEAAATDVLVGTYMDRIDRAFPKLEQLSLQPNEFRLSHAVAQAQAKFNAVIAPLESVLSQTLADDLKSIRLAFNTTVIAFDRWDVELQALDDTREEFHDWVRDLLFADEEERIGAYDDFVSETQLAYAEQTHDELLIHFDKRARRTAGFAKSALTTLDVLDRDLERFEEKLAVMRQSFTPTGQAAPRPA